jgi:hypothetical protein
MKTNRKNLIIFLAFFFVSCNVYRKKPITLTILLFPEKPALQKNLLVQEWLSNIRLNEIERDREFQINMKYLDSLSVLLITGKNTCPVFYGYYSKFPQNDTLRFYLSYCDSNNLIPLGGDLSDKP